MNNTIKKIIDGRQAIKKYSDKTISKEDWEDIIDMIQWSPTAHGWEPYRVLTFKRGNPIREELKEASWGQSKVVTADKLTYFISLSKEVFTDDTYIYENSLRKMEGVLSLEGDEAIKGAKNQAAALKPEMELEAKIGGDQWAMKQAYIGATAGMMAAGILGVGSTAMEGIDKDKTIEVLKKHGLIEENERIALAVTFGYPVDETSFAHFGSGKRIRISKDKKFKEL